MMYSPIPGNIHVYFIYFLEIITNVSIVDPELTSNTFTIWLKVAPLLNVSIKVNLEQYF